MNPKAHHCLTLFENKDRRRITPPEGEDPQCLTVPEGADWQRCTLTEGRRQHAKTQVGQVHPQSPKGSKTRLTSLGPRQKGDNPKARFPSPKPRGAVAYRADL